jgi:ParB-like nuclease family protein
VDTWTPFAPSIRKDAADYTDANPVEAEHVYLLMSKNFPPEAIEWVKRAKWTGPIWVPWDRVDTDDKDKWAASHQPEKVQEFEKQMKAHNGRVAPSILVQEPNSQKAFIVDGHHRALAHENLKQKILAYLGNIDPKDRMAAEETHSKQIHSGADPENKDIEALLVKLEGFWYRREVGLPVSRRDVFKVLAELRDAGRNEMLLSLQAQDFGWSIEQLDSTFLRSWLCAPR